MQLYLLVILPICASLLLYLLPSRITTMLSGFVFFAVLCFSLRLFWCTRFLGEIITTQSSESFLGITLYCDLSASVFLVLVSFLFLCMFLFTNIRERTDKLYSFLFTVLEGLVLLIFLSRDFFNIYVAIEVSSIVCAILIMFEKEARSIYDGLVYLLVNIVGMLFFLLGIGMLYRQLGVLDFDSVIALIATRTPRELAFTYALLLTGVLLKCAAFPMYFWLPLAHGTPGSPTSVSAILSGIYVKSGVYLFIRVVAIFAPVIDLSAFLFWVGVMSALAGIVMAICQSDIKLILAYHTISQIGLIIAGLSSSSAYVQAGAMLHIINHAFFKSLLFLAAGMMIHSYKTRNIYKIHGVMRTMPLCGVAIIAGVLGITGAPFFNGSISKYFLAQSDTLVPSVMFMLINFGTTVSFVKFSKVLFGKKEDAEHHRDFWEIFVVLTLSALCLLTGLLGEPLLYLVTGLHLQIGVSGYVQKILIWFINFVLAYVLYRHVLSKSTRLKAGIDFTICFNNTIICICCSFMALYAFILLSIA